MTFSYSINTYFDNLLETIAEEPSLQDELSAQYSSMLTTGLVMSETPLYLYLQYLCTLTPHVLFYHFLVLQVEQLIARVKERF